MGRASQFQLDKKLEDGYDVASIYTRLSAARQEILDRGRENALFTIPSSMPPEGTDEGQALYRPYQSVGSHGVNTLTSKLVQTLLPANNPVFRFSVSDEAVEDLSQDANARSGVEKRLNEIERTTMDEIEGMGIRAALTEAIKQLIIVGNVLVYLPPKGNLKVYKLDRYVVQRDFEGSLLKVIIKETVAREILPKDVLEVVTAMEGLPSEEASGDSADMRELDIYTVFDRDGDNMSTYQWIKGYKLPRSFGTWPIDKSPIMALRWSYLHDEDYGRAFLDAYLGDLTAVERMSQNIREGVAVMTKVNILVDPLGQTRAKDVAEAENLEIISGRDADVTMMQTGKQGDLQFAGEYLNQIIRRLETAFLLNSSARRDAERVTAAEFQSVIKDIDDTLGGVYSLLANDLQKPLVSIILYRLERDKIIPKITSLKGADGKKIAVPKIVTGIEALGRGHDYNKYRTFMTDIIIPLGERGLGDLNINDLIIRAATALSIDTDGLIKSDEDKQREQAEAQAQQEQAQQAQLAQSVVSGATPQVAKAGAEVVAQQLAGQQQQPTEGS